jgi:hypothetical protein
LFQGETGGGAMILVDDGDAGGYFAQIHSTVIHVDFGTTNRGFGLAPDGIHHFTVLIPNQGYFDEAAGGILSLGFRAALIVDNPDAEESLGIDNISLSTKCSDPFAGRLLEQEQTWQDKSLADISSSLSSAMASTSGHLEQQQREDHSTHKLMIVDSLGLPLSSQPKLDVDIDSYYCANADYPCEGNKVYVCHHSLKRGYATYCIPEPDSDILRFYDTDYCGPCQRGGRQKPATING